MKNDKKDEPNLKKINMMRLNVLKFGEDDDGSATPKLPPPLLELSESESER